MHPRILDEWDSIKDHESAFHKVLREETRLKLPSSYDKGKEWDEPDEDDS